MTPCNVYVSFVSCDLLFFFPHFVQSSVDSSLCVEVENWPANMQYARASLHTYDEMATTKNWVQNAQCSLASQRDDDDDDLTVTWPSQSDVNLLFERRRKKNEENRHADCELNECVANKIDAWYIIAVGLWIDERLVCNGHRANRG